MHGAACPGKGGAFHGWAHVFTRTFQVTAIGPCCICTGDKHEVLYMATVQLVFSSRMCIRDQRMSAALLWMKRRSGWYHPFDHSQLCNSPRLEDLSMFFSGATTMRIEWCQLIGSRVTGLLESEFRWHVVEFVSRTSRIPYVLNTLFHTALGCPSQYA